MRMIVWCACIWLINARLSSCCCWTLWICLLTVQSTRNTVPVPRHWCFKRKYLQGKRGIEKSPFNLPDFIKVSGNYSLMIIVVWMADLFLCPAGYGSDGDETSSGREGRCKISQTEDKRESKAQDGEAYY